MSRGRPLALTTLVLVLLGLLPAMTSAQSTPPLSASLVFDNPPANLTFNATTPIKINLILANVSGAQIITLAGFSSSEFWRHLYFQLAGVGTIADASASLVHAFIPFGTCHYRNSVLLPGTGIQVTPVEVLPGNYAVQFSLGDARAYFDLSRPGRYTVAARTPFYAYGAGAIITDCNVEFNRQSLLSIGDNAAPERRQFSIVSNSLEFVIPATEGPAISARIGANGVHRPRVFYYDIGFTNNGTDVARAVSLRDMTFLTLSGFSNVSYNKEFSPKLPLALGDIATGATTWIRVYLTVPKQVTRFSITESGRLKNAAGETLPFSTTQTVTP